MLWTGLNALGGVYLAARVAYLFQGRTRLVAGLTTLLSVPVMMALQAGQPMVLIGCAFGEFVLALRARRGFLSGLWLSVMILKPQYGLLMGPILLWKRQWLSAVGAAAGMLVVILVSLFAAGRRRCWPIQRQSAVSAASTARPWRIPR